MTTATTRAPSFNEVWFDDDGRWMLWLGRWVAPLGQAIPDTDITWPIRPATAEETNQ